MILVAAVMLTSAAAAVAETAAHPDDGWHFAVIPYLWLAGLDGDVRSGRFSSGGVEASFDDIFDDLEAAFMGVFEARKGRWGAILDVMYIDLSGSGEAPGRLIGEVDVDLTQGLYSLAGFYRALEMPLAVDLLAGVRYADLSVDLDVAPGKYPQLLKGRSVSDDMAWWNGFLGLRLLYPLGKRWSLAGYTDFGFGGSDTTFQAIGAVKFKMTEHLVLDAGYRYLYLDADDNELVYDMSIGGPFLGLGIVF
jgi:hypothetical protein